MKTSFLKNCLAIVAAGLISTSALAVQGDSEAASLDELLNMIKRRVKVIESSFFSKMYLELVKIFQDS